MPASSGAMLSSNGAIDDDAAPNAFADDDADQQTDEQRKAAALAAYRRSNPGWFYELPPKAERTCNDLPVQAQTALLLHGPDPHCCCSCSRF